LVTDADAEKPERAKTLSEMTKEEKKEHKKKVKEDNREKRKTKTPKYIKKRAE
jgi:RIO kinase 1